MCPLLSSCRTTFICGHKYITGLIIQLHLVKIYHPFCSQKGYVHMEILVSFSLLKIFSFLNSKVRPTTFLCESLWSWRIYQVFISSFVYHLSVCFMHSINNYWIFDIWKKCYAQKHLWKRHVKTLMQMCSQAGKWW